MLYCIGMRNTANELEQFLNELANNAGPGERLPPIRDLMRRFGVSQVIVQRAFQSLKSRGLIASQVGRGTYFKGGSGQGAPKAGNGESAATSSKIRSVLLLRRSISIIRGRALVDGLQRRFAADGNRVLEVSYTDPEHARTILRGLPGFDAGVVQSSFKTITIELLAALREKTDVLAVDGAALAGADVDSVGMEWGEPLAVAISRLQQSGHCRIAYATTLHPFLASQLGRRRFDYLQANLQGVDLESIFVPHLPGDEYEEYLIRMIRENFEQRETQRFTAIVAWGIEDGARFRMKLADLGVEVPSRLSVILLGRTDLANEHADFFDTVGCSVVDQIEYLYQAITARWSDPSLPYGVRLIPVTMRAGRSIAAPFSG